MRKVGISCKNCVPDDKEVKECSKTTKYKKCIYVQNEINKIDESFDLTLDNEHTFSTSYFHEEPILDV